MVTSTTTRTESFTRDPIGYKGSPFDLYEFLDTSPLQKYDPMGLDPDDPACRACDAVAAACYTVAGMFCALDLAEIPLCISHFFPWMDIPTLIPPCRTRVPHPCTLFQPPGSPARIACCVGIAVGKCALELGVCTVVWQQCYRTFDCYGPPQPPRPIQIA